MIAALDSSIDEKTPPSAPLIAGLAAEEMVIYGRG